MGRIILIRHGETDWNKEEIFRGRIDVKLNDMGIKQAEETGRALAEIKIQAVYTSPLIRAKDTARKIVEFQKVPLYLEESFIDIHFGVWQGVSLREVQRLYKQDYETWKNAPHMLKFTGGESLEEVSQRSMKALRHLVTDNEDVTYAIVTHRVVCKVMILKMLGLPLNRFWDIRMDTCGISIFSYMNKRWIVELLNDTCHLKALQKERLADF